ncbi:hypothetical protein OG21DRAFT_1428763, partial [Imleria badia]
NVAKAILEGKQDVICMAGTGMGKTLGFWIPLLFWAGLQIVIMLLQEALEGFPVCLQVATSSSGEVIYNVVGVCIKQWGHIRSSTSTFEVVLRSMGLHTMTQLRHVQSNGGAFGVMEVH